MNLLAFSDNDVELVKAQLAAQCRLNNGNALHCLEWGSGGSTIEFPKFLRTNCHPFRYVSVEHNIEWYKKVIAELCVQSLNGLVQVRLEQCEGDPFKEPMDSYVGFPLTMSQRWNFIFIDGRKRRRCLINAAKLLAPGGVVMLHDSERPWYHCAFEHYTKHEHIGDKLWLGKVDL